MQLGPRGVLAAVTSFVVAAAALVAVTPVAHADPESGSPLPAGPGGTPFQVKVFDDTIYATWGSDSLHTTVYSTPADGSGSWEPVLDPTTAAPLTSPQSLGDGIVIPRPVKDVDDSCYQYRVVTATTAWAVPAAAGCTGPVKVGVGGSLVAVPVLGQQHAVYDVYDAVQGPAAGVLREVIDQEPMLDGTWIVTDTPFRVWLHDTSGQHPDFSVPLPDGCYPLQVDQAVGDPLTSSGYALVHCSWYSQVLVVPLDGRVPLVLPDGSWRLGNGFVFETEPAPGGTQVRVMDLSGALTQRAYGPSTPGSAGVSASDSGSPMAAYVTPGGALMAADLGWVGSYPTPQSDTTPPQVDQLVAPGAAIRYTGEGMQIPYAWSGSDDDGAPVRFDAEQQDSNDPGWRGFHDLPQTFRTAGTVSAYEPETVCVRVRAEDRAGNVSPWTKRCTRLDSARPTMRYQHGPAHPVLGALGPTRVRFPLQGSDDGPLTYQVQRRSAWIGHALGAWTTPPTWRAVGESHVDSPIGRHREVCFRARATDHVHPVSAWGRPWCRAAPYDDASLTRRHAVVRHVAGAIGGTATRLRRGRASLSHANLSGRVLWVRARGAGCPHVWWGGRMVMSLGCSDEGDYHGFSWFVAYLPHRRSGTVSISVGDYWGWADIDAIAVLR